MKSVNEANGNDADGDVAFELSKKLIKCPNQIANVVMLNHPP